MIGSVRIGISWGIHRHKQADQLIGGGERGKRFPGLALFAGHCGHLKILDQNVPF